MDELVNQNAADHLFSLFALAYALIIFWFLESVWRLDRRWLAPVIIFPGSILMFIFLYWEESRSKCFFAIVLTVVMLMVGGFVGKSFFVQIFNLFELIAFWPYFVGKILWTYIH